MPDLSAITVNGALTPPFAEERIGRFGLRVKNCNFQLRHTTTSVHFSLSLQSVCATFGVDGLNDERHPAFRNPTPITQGPHSAEPLFTIGDLAKDFQVSLRTLRFYEDRGLLAPYRDGTARFYTEQDKSRLGLILKAKHLGFTLGEIRDMLSNQKKEIGEHDSLDLNPEQIASQIEHLQRQRDEIDAAIAELRKSRERVERA